MVKVKVCGITNLTDARKAVDFGADALGFNFYAPSPRFIAPEKVQAILSELPREVCKIALFVNAPKEKVLEVIAWGVLPDHEQAFNGLQFHGEEGAEYCRGWSLKVIKAFRLKDRESLVGLYGFPADFYLLDSWAPGYGGSGLAFPWDWLEGLRSDRLILAGGLDVQNVAEAVRRFRPYGVDVCTGVEAKPGIKDHAKLKDFILAAKGSG
ncbi:MAG: phosphoribosylanthranilate isomerase [Deltaproteobacteria bacterium]|nr:phosphoribosylanthranilate isomerase [Deltaproteobacteria bacterium]